MRGLTDYPPRTLPESGKRLWGHVFRAAERLYTDQWAAHVADKVTADLWTGGGRQRSRAFQRLLPDPGNTIMLGFALDVHYWGHGGKGGHGRIAIQQFTPLRVPCLWSPRLKAVLIFPQMRVPPATLAATSLPALLREYKKFHADRAPKDGASAVSYPEAKFTTCLPAVAQSYNSDKFDQEGDFVGYIHHNHCGKGNAPGPMVYLSRECVMIRGGDLRLTREGLVH